MWRCVFVLPLILFSLHISLYFDICLNLPFGFQSANKTKKKIEKKRDQERKGKNIAFKDVGKFPIAMQRTEE